MRPDIEQFKKTLKREKAAYVPICELGIHPKIKEKLLKRSIRSLKDEVDFWYQAGYDYIKLQPEVDFNPLKIGLSEKKSFKEDGTLGYNWASEGKGIITSEQEFERYQFPEVSDIGYKKFEEVKNILPPGLGVIGQYGDIFTMTWEMMGFESFSLYLFEDTSLIDSLNNKLGNLVLSMFEYFAQSEAVDVLWYSDDIAFSNGLLMSPEVLRRYIFPWIKRIGQLAKEYNKPLIYHTDGILYEVLDDIIACNVDALHPIEPKAMKIKEVKQRYGDQLCLIGHVDVDLLCRGTKEAIRKKVKENIEDAGYNGGYCVGSGNSIPDYVNFDNYIAMNEAAREFGR